MVKANVEAIKAARLERGWSSSELAKRAGATNETVRRIERGCSTLPSTAKRLADVLEVPVTELFSIT